METTRSSTPTITLIFKAVAAAMGIASIVLNVLGTVTPQTTGTLLGIGLACLAIASLR